MQEAASHKSRDHKSQVRKTGAPRSRASEEQQSQVPESQLETQLVEQAVPFTADHGVNPGWGVYEERPVIPKFNSVAEIGKLALMFTLWSRVEEFVYNDVGIEPLESSKEEKKHRIILLESETYLIALLCLLNNEHYSASGLVDAMVGVDATADQRGNARKRILNRTLPIVGDRYGLIDYSERHMGNSLEYSICRSNRLVEFAETHLVTSVCNIIGDARSATVSEPASVSKRSKRSKSEQTTTVKTRTKKNQAANSGEAK